MILLDGDIIVYRCGFGADKDKEPSLEFAKYNVKSTINKIITSLHDCKYKVFLTGKGNYREKLATLIPYKKSRIGSKKPSFYQEIRDYLEVVYSAEIVHGEEADDAIGKEQCKALEEGKDTIIVSIDKDLDMIPGWHYNFVKDNKYEISELEGYRNFYKQVLLGDKTDDIPGLYRVGKATASKLLKDCTSKEEMDQIVTDTYKKAVKDGRIKLNGLEVELKDDVTVESIINEIKGLLWIKRK